MKKIRLTFVNKSKLVLYIELKNSGDSTSEKFEVKRKSEIKLYTGRYKIYAYYCCSNIDITSNLNGTIDIGEIPSPDDPKFKAKLLLLDHPKKSVRITCCEKISIANLIEGN